MAQAETDLWRGVRREVYPDGTIIDGRPAPGVLYPDFEARRYQSRGRMVEREPDVQVKNGFVAPGGGTSLFDKDAFFGRAHWAYFEIPEGTDIDPMLRIVETGYNERVGANHHQIEVATGGNVTVDAYKGALNNLARAAIVRAHARARGH